MTRSASVRVSALVSLVNLGGGPLAPNDQARFRRVSAEFAAQAALHEDDAVTQAELGLVHLLNDELELAAEALETSLGLDPDNVRAAFLLGLVRTGQQRTDDARRLFEKVPRSDPSYGAAQERLKRLAAPRTLSPRAGDSFRIDVPPAGNCRRTGRAAAAQPARLEVEHRRQRAREQVLARLQFLADGLGVGAGRRPRRLGSARSNSTGSGSGQNICVAYSTAKPARSTTRRRPRPL